jgi:L-lactate dehydrogenase (cytochrome)
LKYAGRDATSVYEYIHPLDALEKNLAPSKHLGPLELESIRLINQTSEDSKKTMDEIRVEKARRRMPPLSRILSLSDMQVIPSFISRISPLHRSALGRRKSDSLSKSTCILCFSSRR